MSFTSLEFLLFLGAVFLVYHAARERWRWLVALLASYAFYGSFHAPQALAALVLVTVASYGAAVRLGQLPGGRRRTGVFWAGVGLCLATLASVKYLPPLFPALAADPSRAFLLNAVGVSYFVFQAIAYLADVYLETQEPERHFGRHALALAFFPKLAQGPIERAGDLLPQLRAPKPFDYQAVRSGLLLFAVGLAKKTILADRLAVYADQVYGNLGHYTGLPILLGTYAYAFQIYFDFAGYTDMARGAARLFGIELTRNFDRPYLATSVPEFWRRWHISFSRWILDYLFKPLQMAWRGLGQAGAALALLVAFLGSGLWHGARAGFLVWGGLHGLYLAASVFYTPARRKWMKKMGIKEGPWLTAWRRFVTFNLVCLAWVFFRAASFRDALYAVRHSLDLGGALAVLRQLGWARYYDQHVLLGQGGNAPVTLLAAIGIYLLWSRKDPAAFWNLPTWRRWCAYYALTLAICLFSASTTRFIYFQF